MNQQENIITLAEQFVRQALQSDYTGHDWWHIDRVRKLTLELATLEQADPFVCELAALLHDIADEKLNESKQQGLDRVRDWLRIHVSSMEILEHVMLIVATMSYNGGVNPRMETIEGKVVQDADRLDAMGAIGIARAFTYGGAKGRAMHDPQKVIASDVVDYRANDQTTLAHFYIKLLKLKDLMNTTYAKELAEQRHIFMEQFLQQFYGEWEGKR
ncbi:uncharacterized protein J2Z69_001294 [Paenibacillus shirakamiensis]|uniref:HD/PDEase domain-containing protein n=1 Tax=Paenibacillus shirakamiensis TaxID=1265935 RepID=A0ABS4JGV8_9BACL|nr:HD domain-containing protein [Paenibacillus shirakamiensis]MBP2000275.1 uncharacterized protein [Paenibacillus shirakamiensis]